MKESPSCSHSYTAFRLHGVISPHSPFQSFFFVKMSSSPTTDAPFSAELSTFRVNCVPLGAEEGAEGVELELDRVAEPKEELLRRPRQNELWAYVWVATCVAADLVLSLPLRGKSVLELGAGIAVPSLAAAKAGATRVVATDLVEDACALMSHNAHKNGVEKVLQPRILDWVEQAKKIRKGGEGDEKDGDGEGGEAGGEGGGEGESVESAPYRGDGDFCLDGFDVVFGVEILFLERMLPDIVGVMGRVLGGDVSKVGFVVDIGRASASRFGEFCEKEGLGVWSYAAKSVATSTGVLQRCVVHVVWAKSEEEEEWRKAEVEKYTTSSHAPTSPLPPATLPILGIDEDGEWGNGLFPNPDITPLAATAIQATLQGLRKRSGGGEGSEGGGKVGFKFTM